MADLGHDAVFVEEAAALRTRLQRCARVLYPGIDGDTRQADRAVDEALARTYALGPEGERTIAAARGLLHPRWRRTRSGPTAGAAQRIELLDVTAGRSVGLADELAALGPTSQAVVVLALLGGIDGDQLSRVIGTPTSRVDELFLDAVSRLSRTDPSRRDLRVLTAQLGALAGPADPVAAARAGVGDLARGRRLQQRSRIRHGLLAAAAVVVVALVAGLAIRAGSSGPVASAPAVSSTPTRSVTPDPTQSYRCDTSALNCRTQLVLRWRSMVSGVMVEYLDRDRRYFSSMSWETSPSEQSDSFWRGGGGALAVWLSRPGSGGTEVYLQVATDMEYADPCGQRIQKKCRIHQSMDGSVYLVGGDSTGTGGVEVQFVADEDSIITVVAQNVSEGKKLDITDGDLLRLASDTRLQLPRR